MSVEAAVYDILSSDSGVTSLVGGARSPRIYQLAVPQGKSMPAIVYQQISSVEEITCDGPADPRDDRFQIASWADDPDVARAVAEAVRTAMDAASGEHGSVTIRFCSFDGEGDRVEIPPENETLSRYGKSQDWIIAYET